MNGIYVEEVWTKDCKFWAVKDCKTGKIYSVGNSIVVAVDNYETMLANEEMAYELGVSSDDMDI